MPQHNRPLNTPLTRPIKFKSQYPTEGAMNRVFVNLALRVFEYILHFNKPVSLEIVIGGQLTLTLWIFLSPLVKNHDFEVWAKVWETWTMEQSMLTLSIWPGNQIVLTMNSHWKSPLLAYPGRCLRNSMLDGVNLWLLSQTSELKSSQLWFKHIFYFIQHKKGLGKAMS